LLVAQTTITVAVMKSDVVGDAAKLLRDAEEFRIACGPVRELIGASDVNTAYAVQAWNVQLGVEAGRRIVGRKVGLTAKVVQAQLGVDQPDLGECCSPTCR
jgi:2-keto-4-pentenoate hydratase